ncbi:MAG TPA: hypothetical protein VF616_05780 [Duganella sp.]|uniref:hypothetical protein n=1 Tax=Duganella sp. TaxID=1904440 RepID=UPI002ED60F59
MTAFIYLAHSSNLDVPVPGAPTLSLDSSPEYWFLYRYFESANLDRSAELIDLYGGGVIEEYQLHRLRTELELARSDVESKPDTWRVLVGWDREVASIETEDWRSVEKITVYAIIQTLLKMIQYSETNGVRLVTSGD